MHGPFGHGQMCLWRTKSCGGQSIGLTLLLAVWVRNLQNKSVMPQFFKKKFRDEEDYKLRQFYQTLEAPGDAARDDKQR